MSNYTRKATTRPHCYYSDYLDIFVCVHSLWVLCCLLRLGVILIMPDFASHTSATIVTISPTPSSLRDIFACVVVFHHISYFKSYIHSFTSWHISVSVIPSCRLCAAVPNQNAWLNLYSSDNIATRRNTNRPRIIKKIIQQLGDPSSSLDGRNGTEKRTLCPLCLSNKYPNTIKPIIAYTHSNATEERIVQRRKDTR